LKIVQMLVFKHKCSFTFSGFFCIFQLCNYAF